MTRSNRSIARFYTSAVLGLSVVAGVLGTATVASAASGTSNAASGGLASPCATGLAVVVSSPSGDLQPACVTQQGNVLVIALARDLGNGQPPTGTLGDQPSPSLTPPPGPPPTGLSSLAIAPTSLATTPSGLATPTTVATPTAPGTSPDAEPDMSAVTDPRINSYAKRQAIRDQYRGQMDETTFNDELGDGDPLESALNDALAAFHHPHP